MVQKLDTLLTVLVPTITHKAVNKANVAGERVRFPIINGVAEEDGEDFKANMEGIFRQLE